VLRMPMASQLLDFLDDQLHGSLVWEDGVTQQGTGSNIRFKENNGKHIHFEVGSGTYEMKIRQV
jgi:hypothetical protein